MQVTNYSQTVYHGWIRATSDAPQVLEHAAPLLLPNCQAIPGRMLGERLRVVDVRGQFEPGHTYIDLTEGVTVADAIDELEQPPALQAPSINHWPLVATAEPQRDGAAFVYHWHGRPLRLAPMLHVDVWLTHYPGQAWATG